MKSRSTLLPALFLLMSPFYSASSDPADRLAQEIQSIKAEYNIVGLSAAAVRGGNTVWQASLGRADIERDRPVTPATKFRVASISKLATSVALMQFWEKGKFDLDDDISDHLGFSVVNPDFPEKPITIRHLLTHTSSLRDGPNYNDFLMATYRAGDQAPPLRELIHAEGESYNEGANFANHPPGAEYEYCNLNFGIIGTLVEIFSGERFDDYCRRNIFEPLETTASFNEADLPDIEELAAIYRPGENGWEPQFDNHAGQTPTNRIGPKYRPGHNGIVFSPQGGLRASVPDLISLMFSFTGSDATSPPLLEQSTIERMLQEHWSNGEDEENYRGRGLGFQRTTNVVSNEVWVGHGGRAYGLLAKLYFQLDGDTGIIIVTNGSEPGNESREMYAMERDLFKAILNYLETP